MTNPQSDRELGYGVQLAESRDPSTAPGTEPTTQDPPEEEAGQDTAVDGNDTDTKKGELFVV